MQDLNNRHRDANGIEHDSVLEATAESIPVAARVPNEEKVDSVEWLAEYPPLDSAPDIAPFNSVTEMQQVLAEIQKAHDDTTIALFSDQEFVELCNFIQQRMNYVLNPAAIARTWNWPVIDRTPQQLAFANPYTSIEDQWKIAELEGFALLTPREQALIKGIRFEESGPGPNFMEAKRTKKHKAAAAIEETKAVPIVRSTRRNARKESSEEESEASSSSLSVTNEESDSEVAKDSSSNSSESGYQSEESESSSNEVKPKKKTRSGNKY